MLKGKKTYIVAIASIVYAWLGVYTGSMDSQTAIQMSLAALGMSALRHGMSA
jgi:hypothetical protein